MTILPDWRNIASIDVTTEELKSFSKNEFLRDIIEPLEEAWVGDNSERESNVHIGSVYVYLDQEDHLHIDFVTRFHFANDPGLKKTLQKIKQKCSNLHFNNLNGLLEMVNESKNRGY